MTFYHKLTIEGLLHFSVSRTFLPTIRGRHKKKALGKAQKTGAEGESVII